MCPDVRAWGPALKAGEQATFEGWKQTHPSSSSYCNLPIAQQMNEPILTWSNDCCCHGDVWTLSHRLLLIPAASSLFVDSWTTVQERANSPF